MCPESGRSGNRRSRDAARRVRDLIRADMHRGAYAADGRLPSEEQLMRDLLASRSVIRGALDLLRAEGLIDRIQGVGTVVVATLSQVSLEESQGYDERHPALGHGRPQVLEICDLPLPPPIARHLGVPAGDPGTRVDYIYRAAGVALSIVTNYMRMPEAAALRTARFTTNYYAYLADAGLEVTETTFLMEAARADEIDAALLDVPPGSALMVAEQGMLNRKGEVFNYAFVRARGDKSAIFSRVEKGVTGESPADRV